MKREMAAHNKIKKHTHNHKNVPKHSKHVKNEKELIDNNNAFSYFC
jgi:hypothetical protein